jgi:hypothetical protein
VVKLFLVFFRGKYLAGVFRGIGTGVQAAAVVVHYLPALAVQPPNWFSPLIFADDYEVLLNFAVRMEGSLSAAPRAVGQVDAFVVRQFGLTQKDVLLLDT